MLLETDLQIKQIATAIGYHYAGRFSNLFQKKYRIFTRRIPSLVEKIRV